MTVSDNGTRRNPLVTTLLKNYEEVRTRLNTEHERLPDGADLVLVRGLLGEADDDEHVRVFTSLDLREYKDVPRQYIVHVLRGGVTKTRPLTEDLVWVVGGTLISGPGEARGSEVYRPVRLQGRP